MKNDNLKEQYRINERIRVREVRLVGDNIETGVYPIAQALKIAEEQGMDLVEISPNAAPPVCRVIDYQKFLYQQKKRQKEQKAKSVKVVVKEIRFGISAGQRKLTRFLLNYHFNAQDIWWLRTKGMSEEFCEYLRTYRWKGDMYALPEGTVCYPHVQMVRIECDLVGAILIETYLLQTMNFHSLIATKATRVTGLNTHTPRSVMEFGTRRAQGESAGNDGAYAAVLGGCVGTANCLAEMKFGSDVKAVGTVAHSFIEFFPTEFDAFKAFADTYPDSVSLLLDTYNIMESGLPNLIKLDDYLIEKYPNDPNRRVKSARIDSGDLARGSKRLRKALDAVGKPYIKLVASNGLDEKKIANMELYEHAHFDSYALPPSS